jgi:hypothetical protein
MLSFLSDEAIEWYLSEGENWKLGLGGGIPLTAFQCYRSWQKCFLSAYHFSIVGLGITTFLSTARMTGAFSEWRKLPISLSELCINTTLRCGQSFR